MTDIATAADDVRPMTRPREKDNLTLRYMTGILPVLFAFAGAAVAEPVPRERVQAAVARIGAMAEDLIEAGEVPGLAIGIVQGDEVIWTQGFGVRRMGSPDSVDADTVFPLASLSKPIAATVVAGLVGKRVLDWDDRIRDLDPGFALHDPYPTVEVTVRDMFGHRSGLPGSAGNDLEQIGFDRATVMERLRLVPAWTGFRGGYVYSNAAFTEGGLAAAQPTGKDWEIVAKEELFGPLGMNSTSYRNADFLDRLNAVAPHVKWQGAWTPQAIRDPTSQGPAGGATSSVNDMTRWMRLELDQGSFDGAPVIPVEALAPTHVPLMARGMNPITGAESFYGLGCAIEIGRHGVVWQHAGAFSYGALTLVKFLPDSQLGIVVLSNGFPNGAPEALGDSFFDLAIDGELARDYLAPWSAHYGGMFALQVAEAKALYASPPDPATPALPAAAYVGHYHNAYVGDALVEQQADGALVLALGLDGVTRLPLSHFDRDLLTWFPDAEMPDKPSAVQFSIATEERAESMRIESLDANGLGTLTRIE